MNNDQQHLIESYLKGDLAPSDRAAFEAQLVKDPELKQEFQFQSEIVEGLRRYRYNELKSRLSAVDVAPYALPWLTPSILVKVVGGLTVIGLIGYGILTLPQQSTPTTSSVEESESVTLNNASSDVVVPETEAPSSSPVGVVDNEVPEEQSAYDTEKTSGKQKSNYRPTATVPGATDIIEDNFSPDDLPKPSTAAASGKSQIDVETIETKSARVKYKYYEGKLFLYGKFENNPYEILEINSSQGRRVYLFHMDLYYEILPSDKIQYVIPITNQPLIEELAILRKAK